MNSAVEVQPITLRRDDQGVMRVGPTRVRLDTIITAWKQGDSPEEIADNFDALGLAEIYGVISYYLQHRSEIDSYLEQNQAAGERIRTENAQRFLQTGIRERWLARRAR
jgi:uncharacterized protein (DUF433 family)